MGIVEFPYVGPPAAVVVELNVIEPEAPPRPQARPRVWYRLVHRDGGETYRELPQGGEEVSHLIVRSNDPAFYVAKVEECDGPPSESKRKGGA